VDGDCCSSICVIEPGCVCKTVYKGIILEKPLFRSQCFKISDPAAPVVYDTSKQWYRQVTADEFVYKNLNVVNGTTGKMRLIEYKDNESLYGVSFVASGLDPTTS